MPASFCFLAVHIIFTTKNHKTWIIKPLQSEMHSYLGGIINKIGGKSIVINGTQDHVHILCLLPKDLSIGEFMAKIKANSSKWFRHTHNPEFNWQDGYAAYSVSKSNIEVVKQYILNQEDHHHNVTASDEFDALIRKHWTPKEDSMSPIKG